MVFRSAWMAAWVIVSLKTQTLGPKAATVASGHIDETGAAGGQDCGSRAERGGGQAGGSQRRHRGEQG